MSWERVIDLALRAYPRDVREARAAEMRDTVLEVSAGSRLLLLREGFTLLGGGVKAHASCAASLSGPRLVAESCRLAVAVWGLAALVVWAWAYRSVYEFGGLTVVGILGGALLALSVALALIGEDRGAGLAGLAWIGVSLMVLLLDQRLVLDPLTKDAGWLATHLLPLIGYLVLRVAPRNGRRELHRLAWTLGLVLSVALLGIVVGPVLLQAQLIGAPWFESGPVLVVAILGLLSLAGDPRRPIAFALALIALGLPLVFFDLTSSSIYTYRLLAVSTAAPMLLLAAAAARLVSARRGLPG